VVNAKPRPLYPRERDPVPIVQETGWASGPVWTGAHRDSIAGPSTPWRVAILTELSRPTKYSVILQINAKFKFSPTNNSENPFLRWIGRVVLFSMRRITKGLLYRYSPKYVVQVFVVNYFECQNNYTVLFYELLKDNELLLLTNKCIPLNSTVHSHLQHIQAKKSNSKLTSKGKICTAPEHKYRIYSTRLIGHLTVVSGTRTSDINNGPQFSSDS